MQQHSLRTNKTSQAAPDRKDRRILTASNVDSLVITLGKLKQQRQYGREASSPRAVVKPSRSFTDSYMKQRGILEPPLPPLDDIAMWSISQQPTTPRKRLYLDRPVAVAPSRVGNHTSRARLAPLNAAVIEQASHPATSSSRDGVLRSVLRQKHIMSLSNGECDTSTAEQLDSSISNKQGSHTARYAAAPTNKQRYTTTRSGDTIISKRGSVARCVATSSSARSINTARTGQYTPTRCVSTKHTTSSKSHDTASTNSQDRSVARCIQLTDVKQDTAR